MSTLIEEADVTIVNLAVELERAVIQHDLQEDQSIYITEDGLFPFWVRVYEGNGFIGFKTHTLFKRGVSERKKLEICNSFNQQIYMATACVSDDQLCIDYVLNYRDGVLRETFIRGCRQFARNIERGLADIDLHSNFVLPPGKTENETE